MDERVLHRIEDDLADGWLEAFIGHGIEAVEAYLAKHAAFHAFLEERD